MQTEPKLVFYSSLKLKYRRFNLTRVKLDIVTLMLVSANINCYYEY